MNDVVVRKARFGDLPSITRVLTSAFEHHPLRQYLLPGARRRKLAVTCGDTVLFAEGMAYGSALVGTINGRVAGVLCWLPPEAYPRSPTRKAALSIARIPFLFCPPVGFKGMKFQPAIDAFHIKDPALYFTLAATHRDDQGKGVATRLLAAMTEQAERDALPIFLETSNHRNVSLYQRHGFQLVAEASPVEGGPTVFAMVRPASSAT